MNIKVLSYYDCFEDPRKHGNHSINFEKVGNLSSKNHQYYCDLHNYQYILEKNTFNFDKHIHFKKIKLLIESLKDCDYLFYIDSDAIFANLDIKIESIIEKWSKDSDVIISPAIEHQEVNAGIILLKNTENSKKFLDNIWNNKLRDGGSECDQKAIREEVRKQEKDNYFNISTPPYYVMNSIMHKIDRNFEHGHFIMHLAGCANEYRVEQIEKYIKENHNGLYSIE